MRGREGRGGVDWVKVNPSYHFYHWFKGLKVYFKFQFSALLFFFLKGSIQYCI